MMRKIRAIGLILVIAGILTATGGPFVRDFKRHTRMSKAEIDRIDLAQHRWEMIYLSMAAALVGVGVALAISSHLIKTGKHNKQAEPGGSA